MSIKTRHDKAVRKKRPQLWESGDCLLYNDNTPAHALNPVQQYLAKHKIKRLR